MSLDVAGAPRRALAKVDVTALVPGDVVRLALGEVVPAAVRLIEVKGSECNESILSGESAASEKSLPAINADAGLTDWTDLAFMGTIVSAGDGLGAVYATGVDTEFGRIAAGLGVREPETEFQAGLRRILLPAAVGGAGPDGAHLGHQPVAASDGD